MSEEVKKLLRQDVYGSWFPPGSWYFSTYPGLDHPYGGTKEVAEQWYRQSIHNVHLIAKEWERFLRYFNDCCNAFCRNDPAFAPFLEEVIRFEEWKFPLEEFLKKSAIRSDEARYAGILKDAGEYPHRFLAAFYSLYQKIPQGERGIFSQSISEVTGQELVKEIYHLCGPGPKGLFLSRLKELVYPRVEKKGKDEKPIFPVPDYKAVLKDTPFSELVQAQFPFDINVGARLEHMDICAGTGHGKSWIIQSFLTDLLQQGYGFLVMDSQGALIPKILALKPLLNREVIYINPEDREYIPGITFFGVNLVGVEDNEEEFNTLISLYESIFADLMGSGLTEKQGFMFGYCTQLLLTIPKATIFTFIDILTNGEKYRPYMQRLPSTARYFFEHHFFQKTYDHTKQEIARKLLGLVKTPTIDRILNNTEQRIDFHKAMNEGAIILINTSKKFLQDALSSFFGKFLLGMIYTNVVKRDPDGKDPPFFFFIDEAQEYFLKSMGRMFSQFRKYNVGLTIAHQNLKQLKEKGIDEDVRASTSVKIVGSPDKEDAHVFAAEMRVPVEFFHGCRKYKQEGYSEWACFVRHQMDRAVKIMAPWYVMDRIPKMTKEEQAVLLARNRRTYCVRVGNAESHNDGFTADGPQGPTELPPAHGESAPSGLDRAPPEPKTRVRRRDDSVWD